MPDLTPDPAAREAMQAIGDSIANNLGQAFGQLAATLARVMVEQAELRDELHELTITVATLRKPPTVHTPDNG